MRTLSARARAANASDPSAQLGSELDQHRVATRNLYMARIHTITVVYGTECRAIAGTCAVEKDDSKGIYGGLLI